MGGLILNSDSDRTDGDLAGRGPRDNSQAGNAGQPWNRHGDGGSGRRDVVGDNDARAGRDIGAQEREFGIAGDVC